MFNKEYFLNRYSKFSLGNNELVEQVILDVILYSVQASAIFILKFEEVEFKDINNLTRGNDHVLTKKIYDTLGITEEDLSYYYNLAFVENKFEVFIKEIEEKTNKTIFSNKDIDEDLVNFYDQLFHNAGKEKEWLDNLIKEQMMLLKDKEPFEFSDDEREEYLIKLKKDLDFDIEDLDNNKEDYIKKYKDLNDDLGRLYNNVRYTEQEIKGLNRFIEDEEDESMKLAWIDKQEKLKLKVERISNEFNNDLKYLKVMYDLLTDNNIELNYKDPSLEYYLL